MFFGRRRVCGEEPRVGRQRRPCPLETLFPEWTCREAASFESDAFPAFPAGRGQRGTERSASGPGRAAVFPVPWPRLCTRLFHVLFRNGRCSRSFVHASAPAGSGFYCQDAVLRAKVPLPVFPEETNVLGLRKNGAFRKRRQRRLQRTSAAVRKREHRFLPQKKDGPGAAHGRERRRTTCRSLFVTMGFRFRCSPMGGRRGRKTAPSRVRRSENPHSLYAQTNDEHDAELARMAAQTGSCRRYGRRRRGSISAHAQTSQISRQHQMTRPMTRTLSARSPCRSTLMGEYSGLRLRSTSFPPGRVSTCLM